jgi:hypothetical protein
MRLASALCLGSLFALLTFSATAQSRTSASAEDVGSVSGHIVCSDTQRPARLAQVRLVPTSIAAASGKTSPFQDDAAMGSQLPPVETDMSGAYTVRNAKPGNYFLRVDYDGYLTPLLGFTRAQLAKPGVDDRQRMQQELQIVSVAAHAATQADVTLSRGAAISGTVLYDDGAPAIGVSISLLRRDAKGEFKEEFHPSRYIPPSDDHGRYRIDSLPAGEFMVKADFALNDYTVTTIPMPNGGGGTVQMTMTKVLFDLPVYSGEALRLRDATAVKTDAGQEASGVDLTLPLSKLHRVSGTLIAKDGHTVNAGKVALLYADTREELTNVPVSRDDGQFHFLYVPEGNYILAVQEASDVTQVEVANAAGVQPKFHVEDKTLHSYGTVEQPLTVEGEMSSVLATVPEAGGAATATATP